tara:strand:+ start:25 stop:576 length:552 start_codon:yes stop_codon:yes gene_type:complete
MKNMNLEDIQELIKFVAKSGATEVDLEIDNIKISIKSPPKKKRGEVDLSAATISQSPQIIPPSHSVVVPAVAAPAANIDLTKKESPVSEEKPSKNNEEESDNSKYITIKSSMIGTFYRSSAPEKPAFVNVGDSIKQGDTICIIEAMKLFNEIESEISGTIIKVLVDDATPIEFDQPIFLIDPS